MTKKNEKYDDKLTDIVREICDSRGQELADTQYSFGHDHFQNGRAMRGLLTHLVKEGLVKLTTTAEQDEALKPVYAVGVSVLLTNSHGQLLLAKRKNNSGAGLLSTPGGRLEYNESVEECAAREFKEECGAALVSVPNILGWKKHNRFGKHYIMFYVHAQTWQGEITNCIPDKSDDWEWFDIEPLTQETCTEPGDILHRVQEMMKGLK